MSPSRCDSHSAADVVMDALERVKSFPLIAEGSSTWVGYQGHYVRLVGLDEATHDSLLENLAPIFEVTTSAPSPGAGCAVIYCRRYVSSASVESAIELGEPREVFRSAMFTTLGRRVECGQVFLFENLYSHAVFCGDKSSMVIHAFSKAGLREPHGVRFAREVHRLAREIIQEQMYRDGYVFMHASGVETDGLATLFCGPKNSGKTTALFELLPERGVGFLANDLVALGMGDDGVRPLPFPGGVTVKVRTLRDYAERSGRWQEVAAELGQAETGDPDEKILIRPRRFLQLLGTHVPSAAHLARIVFLEPCPEPSRPATASPLSPGEAHRMLLGSLQGVRQEYIRWLDLLMPGPEVIEENGCRVAEEISRSTEILCVCGGHGFASFMARAPR